jgi:hypothetical protein
MAISSEAKKLIRSLTQGAADGYTLMKRAGLDASELAKAIQELPPSMLIVKGAQNEEQVGDSFVMISPDARGDAARLLQS